MPDEGALSVASARQRWAAPGGSHDWTVRIARILLPSAVGVLGAILIAAPLAMRGDISFVLAKDKVAMAKERMRVTSATYRGEDQKGQAFAITAGSAVQTSSLDPVVRLSDLSAKIKLADGPAEINADRGRYNMKNDIIQIDGPVRFTAADGFSLETRDVAVGLKSRQLASGGAVNGTMPLGSFSADRIRADLSTRVVTLEGRARLHIVQRSAR